MGIGELLKVRLLGVELYDVLSWFWIYSFIGWIWESSYVSLKHHRLVNRGFVTGPALTIYGCGAVAVYLLMRPFSGNAAALYLGGVAVTTLLEYVTGVLMEAVFHASWWDYSDKKFNFQGKICLGSSLAWGFFTLALFYIFQPFVEWVVGLYPRRWGELGLAAVTAVYGVDFCVSAFAAFHIREKLQGLEQTWDEFVEYVQASRLGGSVEQLKARGTILKRELSNRRLRTYLEERKRQFSEYFDRLSEERPELWDGETRESLRRIKEEYLSRFERFTDTYLKKRSALDGITKRYIKAYPHLASSWKRRKTKGERRNQGKREKQKERETGKEQK